MTEAVQKAIDEIRAAHAESRVDVQDDGQGGANVLVDPVLIGQFYMQPDTWVGFRITFQYPHADVYPHFARSDLTRKDGRGLGEGITGGHTFLGKSALQLSRRSKRLNPATDTAVLKLLKVIEWLSKHP